MPQLLFPFDAPRNIQSELISDVQNAIQNRRHLIAHAPTGLGKTAATLGPALTAALEKGYSVFFLTPKHAQHQIAIETLQKIKQKHKINFTVADLIGKKWMCSIQGVDKLSSKEFNDFCKNMREDEKCPYFNGVFGQPEPSKAWRGPANSSSLGKGHQLQGAAMHLVSELKGRGPIHAEELFAAAHENFCSYEIASLLGRESQVVIADYYHIFQPSVRQYFLGRLRKETKNSVLIIDEGHNLPSRVREILSEKLTSFIVERAAKEAKYYQFYELVAALSHLADAFDNLSKSLLAGGRESHIKKEEFVKELEGATGMKYDDFASNLESVAVEIRKTAKKSFVGSVSDFLEKWTGDDVGFSRIIAKRFAKSGKSFVEVSYNCLSPAISAGEVINESVSTILMSGTLVPGEMYRDLLGFPAERTDLKTYPSPFPPQNRLVLIEPTTTTKFTSRNVDEYKKIADECIGVVNSVPNNCAIFFPSYFIMQSILPFLEGRISKQVFIDRSELTKQQRAELLGAFKNAAGSGGLLLGVQGGSMSEGIDLPGEFLKCVIVVGIPLANPDLATKSLIDFYDYKYNRGWDYGYIYPAMTRSIQAAGRCIRTPEDRGAVIFLDKRFAWGNYLKCIPPEWKAVTTMRVADKVKKFFSS